MFTSRPRFLIRLDDACPFMDRSKWQRMEDILDRYSIKPLVGVIPDNADTRIMIEPEDPMFWQKAQSWEKKGWLIALHGYDHVYIAQGGLDGLNPFWQRSEFAGVPLQIQRDKIKKGYNILIENGLTPKYFFAPSHTFDENTLNALRSETNIRIISDTIGRYPYKHKDFVFIPQISGHCSNMPLKGIYTFCFHPNVMSDDGFVALETFLKEYNRDFTSFDEIALERVGEKSLFDQLLSKLFFTYRRVRGLK